MTRRYLRQLDQRKIENPVHGDIIEGNIPLTLRKNTLWVILAQSHLTKFGNLDRLGIRYQTLPSKRWLLAAINQMDPENLLVQSLVKLNAKRMDFDLIKKLGHVQIKEDFVKAKYDCALIIESANKQLESTFKEKISDLIICELDKLTLEYPFLSLTAEVQAKLGLN